MVLIPGQGTKIPHAKQCAARRGEKTKHSSSLFSYTSKYDIKYSCLEQRCSLIVTVFGLGSHGCDGRLD